MTSPVLRLAKLVIDEPFAAIAMASNLLIASKAKKARVRVKQAPRKAAARDTKDERRAMTTQVRAEVWKRAAGKCECCLVATPSEMHHVLGGPDRKTKEDSSTCAALCWPCHRLIHAGQVEALGSLARWAVLNRFTKSATALNRRIDKIGGGT
jgi:uncharacterized cupin superfamily protein